MENLELYLIHVVFIFACVYFSYQSGAKHGRGEIIEDMLDKKLFTHLQLMKAYKIHEDK